MSSKEERVEQLLAFPDGSPYTKWTGTHWRLVEIAAGRLARLAVARWRLEL